MLNEIDGQEVAVEVIINGSNKRRQHKRNISTSLRSCLFFGCRTASASAVRLTDVIGHGDPRHNASSMAVHSSILDSQSSWYNTEPCATLKSVSQSCDLDHFNVVQQQTDSNSDSDQDCQESPLIEIDFSSSLASSSWDEQGSIVRSETLPLDFTVISSVNKDPRSILKTQTTNKAGSSTRISFALGRNLVSIFEYPGYDSVTDQRNDSNHSSKKRHKYPTEGTAASPHNVLSFNGCVERGHATSFIEFRVRRKAVAPL